MAQQNYDNKNGNYSPKKNSTVKKKKKPKFKLSSVFSIFFIVYVCSFFAYMVQANTTGKIPTKDDTIGTSSEDSNSTIDVDSPIEQISITTTESIDSSNLNSNPVPETTPVDESYLDTCLFVGDSISMGFNGYFFVDDANVIAREGLRPDNVEDVNVSYNGQEVAVLDGIVQSGFKNIYIMLGSNGMGWNSNDRMIEGYENFINDIRAKVSGANIYVISVPPVTAEREDTSVYATVEDGLIYNSTIDEFNALLLDMANRLEVHYLDINSTLKNAEGKLPDDITTDGIHFYGETYQQILDFIRSHVVESSNDTEDTTTQDTLSDDETTIELE